MHRNKQIGAVAAAVAIVGGAAGLAFGDSTPGAPNSIGEMKTALEKSKDPAAVAIRRQIDSAPSDLAHELAAIRKAGVDPAEPSVPIPSDQDAAPLYAQWNDLRKAKPMQMAMYASTPHLKYAYTPEQMSTLEHIVDDNADHFALLHSAADRPRLSRSPADGTPGFAGLREAAREIVLESFVESNRGKVSEAIQNQSRGFHIAAHAADQEGIAAWLTGVAIEKITLSSMQEIMLRTGPNTDADQEITQSIQNAPATLSLKKALMDDVRLEYGLLEKHRLGSDADLSLYIRQTFDFQTQPAPATLTASDRKFADHFVQAGEAQYLHEMNTLIAAADKPAKLRRPIFDRLQQAALAESTPLGPMDPFQASVAILSPTFGAYDQVDDLIHAQEQVTLAAAAILEAKARTGQYPDALPAGFIDPFTGNSLIYQREGENGFVVYSVGVDGKFDGGVSDNALMKQAIFRYPAPPPVPLPATMTQ